MPNGKKKKRHKMSTHKRKKDCARIVIRASKLDGSVVSL